jgi:hypothetical protein
LAQFYPIGDDWFYTYNLAVKNFFQPYAHSDLAGFPWLLVALPHGILPLEWGNAINLVIYLLVLLALIHKYDGGVFAMFLTFTSLITIEASRTNNADWVPAIFLLMPSQWTLPFLLAKPQILGAAALIWWKRQHFNWRLLIPSLVVIALSFVIWGWWVTPMLQKGAFVATEIWNYAVFPFGIPMGLYILYCAYRQDDEVLAACATPFFVPYFAVYSLAPLMAVVSSRHRHAGLALYCLSWALLIWDIRHNG